MKMRKDENLFKRESLRLLSRVRDYLYKPSAWRFLYVGPLALCLAMSITSCKDDDEPSEEQKEEQAYQELILQNASENVLSQLTNADLGEINRFLYIDNAEIAYPKLQGMQ